MIETYAQDGIKHDTIVKPANSVVLLTLPLFWSGLFIAEKLCWFNFIPAEIDLGYTLAYVQVALLVLLVLMLRSRRNPLVFAGLIVFSLVSGIVIGSLYWITVKGGEALLNTKCQAELEIKVVSDPRQGVYSQTSEAFVQGSNQEVNGRSIKVRVFWPTQAEAQPLGTVFTASSSCVPLDEDEEWLFQRGISSSLKLHDLSSQHFEPGPIGFIERVRVHNATLIGSIDGSGSDLLRGVVLGDTSALQDNELDRDFKITGLSHLIAVSGGHLMIIAALTCWCSERMRTRHLTEFIILSILLIAYVLLTGLQASAIRACIMTLVASTSWFFGRRKHAPSALGFTALVMLGINPANAFSLGFALSVCSVLGLCLFTPLIQGWLIALVGSPRKKSAVITSFKTRIIEPLALTFTAQAVTLPLTLPTFAMLSLIAPLANLLVMPLITLMIAGGIFAVGIGLFSADAALIPLSILCRIGDVTACLVHWLTTLPCASLPMTIDVLPAAMISILLFASVRLFWPQPDTITARVALMLFMISLALINHVSPSMKTPMLVMMDVGQGDALLVSGKSQTILIDTGEREGDLLKALARQGVRHLDAVVITHLDSDHCQALGVLRGTVPVDHVYFADGICAANQNAEPLITAAGLSSAGKAESLGFGDCIELEPGLTLTMVWPRGSVEEGDNEESICLLLEYDADEDGDSDMNALLTGDAEAETLEALLDFGYVQRVTILKIGHHGSEGAIEPRQLCEMDTNVALISVGAENRFGHPSSDVVRTLDDLGIRTYRTDVNGDVAIAMKKDGFAISCDTITDGYH